MALSEGCFFAHTRRYDSILHFHFTDAGSYYILVLTGLIKIFSDESRSGNIEFTLNDVKDTVPAKRIEMKFHSKYNISNDDIYLEYTMVNSLIYCI